MALFSKLFKKKRGTTLTDEDRDSAIERKKQLKELRNIRFQQELITEQMKLREAQAELEELQNELEPEAESLFGLGQEEMLLANILTKGNISNLFNQSAPTPPTQQSPSAVILNDEINKQAQQIADGLPSVVRKQLKEQNPEALKKAIDLIHSTP